VEKLEVEVIVEVEVEVDVRKEDGGACLWILRPIELTGIMYHLGCYLAPT